MFGFWTNPNEEAPMSEPTPTRADNFTFGLWTVGWRAQDPFGDPTRPRLDPVETVHRLAELAAADVTFHDDDLVPFGSNDDDREKEIERFKESLAETGLVVPMMTTNLLENSDYDGTRHFDYKPLRTEDIDGVWASAAANMPTYLLLKERAAAFRADPEVQAALRTAGVNELAQPTLAAGETYQDLLADRSAFEDFDPEAAGQRGYGFVRLSQLAVEHLLGAR
jgi:hypothetical protein